MYEKMGTFRKMVAKQGLGPGQFNYANNGATNTTTNASATRMGNNDIRNYDFSREFEVKNTQPSRKPLQQPQLQTRTIMHEIPDVSMGTSRELGEFSGNIFAGLALASAQSREEPTRTWVEQVTMPSAPVQTPSIPRLSGPRISAPSYRGGRR